MPGFLSLNHVEGRTFIIVDPVTDIGQVHYLARYSPGTDVGWDQAFPVNDAPAADNRITHEGFADEVSETIYYYVKAVDDVGVESVNALKGKVVTDPQLSGEFREVVFAFTHANTQGGYDFFVYGQSNFRCYMSQEVSWENRLGTTDVPARRVNSEWYDGTGIGVSSTVLFPEGIPNTFDLVTEHVRRVAVDAESRGLQAGTGEIAGYEIIAPLVRSTLYPTYQHLAPGSLTKSCRYANWNHTVLLPNPEDKYIDVKLPVTVAARKILHEQSGSVFALNETNDPYNVVFPDAYSAAPVVQFDVIGAVGSSTWGLLTVGATGFTVYRTGGSGAVTWSFTWRAIGG